MAPPRNATNPYSGKWRNSIERGDTVSWRREVVLKWAIAIGAENHETSGRIRYVTGEWGNTIAQPSATQLASIKLTSILRSAPFFLCVLELHSSRFSYYPIRLNSTLVWLCLLLLYSSHIRQSVFTYLWLVGLNVASENRLSFKNGYETQENRVCEVNTNRIG